MLVEFGQLGACLLSHSQIYQALSFTPTITTGRQTYRQVWFTLARRVISLQQAPLDGHLHAPHTHHLFMLWSLFSPQGEISPLFGGPKIPIFDPHEAVCPEL